MIATLAGRVELHRGQSYKSELLDQPGPLLLGLGTIARNGGFNGGSLRTYGGESPERILVRPGDLYLSLKDVTHKAELLGAVSRVPESVPLGRLTQDTVRLEVVGSDISADYLYWLLKSPGYRAYCRARGTGTTNLDLSRADFLSFEFELPTLSEQQAIAEVLGALDDKITANAALAAAAEELATAHVSAIESVVPLGDVVALSKKQIHPESLGSAVVDHFSIPAFDADALPAIENADSIRSAKFAIVDEVVLLSKLNPRFPRVWRASPGERPALASTEFLVLEPLGLSPQLLWATLSQPAFSSELDARVAGTSGSHQRVKPAEALAVTVNDPRTLPERIRTAINAMLHAASTARLENRTLAATRDALLPQLMSGKLRVRDAARVAAEAGA